jgi:ornithine carbamoyltransferase
MRHLLSLSDLGKDGLIKLLDSADAFKKKRQQGQQPGPLSGRSVALVFEKASTRTRLSLEVAVVELGGHPVVITSAGSQIARGEPIRDTARVLSRMVHAIAFRTSGAERLLDMVKYSSVPVLNALTDQSHPMQLMADLQTVRNRFGKLEGLRYAWVGDGNNMAFSWIEAAGLLGLNLTLACPRGYQPLAKDIEAANARGASVRLVSDPREATAGAHVVSTDVFTSMGQETEQAERLTAFRGFTLTKDLLASADSKHIVLHCLPAHRGEEIDDDVIEGAHSAVWEQAEARLHTSKASLVWAVGADG